METLRLTKDNIAECAARAVEVIRSGGVVLYPTDTLYGLGADALSNDAVDKIYRIKGRDEGKPIHCIVADLHMAAKYGDINSFAEILAEEFLPGPLSLILEKHTDVTTGIGRDMKTIGIRIPKHELCLLMAREFGGPITTTSANKSTVDPKYSVEEILEQLGGGGGIDLIIDAGALERSEPSSMVDVSAGQPVILREGAIDTERIWAALEEER